MYIDIIYILFDKINMSTKDLNDLKLKWSKYAKKEPDWINEGPREIDDVRERVRRETLRGQTTVFHNSLEDYLTRQFRANTVPRVGIHLLLFSVIAYRCNIIYINLNITHIKHINTTELFLMVGEIIKEL